MIPWFCLVIYIPFDTIWKDRGKRLGIMGNEKPRLRAPQDHQSRRVRAQSLGFMGHSLLNPNHTFKAPATLISWSETFELLQYHLPVVPPLAINKQTIFCVCHKALGLEAHIIKLISRYIYLFVLNIISNIVPYFSSNFNAPFILFKI